MPPQRPTKTFLIDTRDTRPALRVRTESRVRPSYEVLPTISHDSSLTRYYCVVITINSLYDMDTHMYRMSQAPTHQETQETEHDLINEYCKYVKYPASMSHDSKGIVSVRVTMSIECLTRDSLAQHTHT